MTDWSTLASLATAAGTLVLAVATFSSVRSANRSARVAEQAFRVALRPVLAPSRPDDPTQKIMFADRHWARLEGGAGVLDVTPDAIYLAMSLRNVGNGIAVIEGWKVYPEQLTTATPWPEPGELTAQTRSLLIPPGDVSFWQGALRDPTDPLFEAVAQGIKEGAIGVDLLYADHEGGQEAMSRFAVVRAGEDRWWVSMARHHAVTRP